MTSSSLRGFSRLSGNLQAVAVGCVNLIFTLVAMVLIDRLGRKTLLLIDCAGMTVALGTIAYVFHGGHARRALLAFVAAYIAFFAISSVQWCGFMSARYSPRGCA